MKRVIALLLLCLLLLSGCQSPEKAPETDQISIVASLFPQYDFAKAIAGDRASVTLLLPPGAESHSYEPKPADVIAINNSDLFIYTGENLEGWADSMLKGLEGNPAVLDLSAGITLHEHEGHEHHGADPHIFTSPRYAVKMAQDIEDKLCEIDPEHAAEYRSRGEAYRKELLALDGEFRQAVEKGARKKLIFGGRFAFLYFVEEYGLDYEAAYDSCSSETEPSAAKLAQIMETVTNEKIPVVYYEELSDPKTARLICEETGAKPLLLHSCHNVSKEELAKGVTYLSLMRENLANLKEGLS